MAHIKEYTSGPMPDWVKKGATVAVIWGRSSDMQVSLETVDHVTATQVTVGDSKYNLKRNLKRIGHTNAWSRTAFLADPEDPQVRLAIMERNLAKAQNLVGKFSGEFAVAPSVETADRVVKAVEIWKEWSAKLDAFAESVKTGA